MSSDPAADGKIRAFLAAVRGLSDTAVQAEAITAQACLRIATDLGAQAPAVQPPATVASEQACALALAQIQTLVGNDRIPIAVSTPSCEPDYVRFGRCQALCSAESGDAACGAMCQAHAAAYGVCRAAKVALPDMTGQAERWVVLANSLARNLPWLLHAQMALGQRLAQHTQALVAAAAELPKSLKDAGPVGIGCLGVGALQITKASTQLNSTSAAGAGLLSRLGLIENPNALANNQPVRPVTAPPPAPAATAPPPAPPPPMPPPAPAPLAPLPQPSPAGAP